MKKVLAVVLALTMALALAGCTTAVVIEPTIVKDGDVVGKGATTFNLEIIDDKGESIHITVNTDKKIVGEALEELGIIEGEEGPYGIFTKSVNGIVAVYEETGTYWAFYTNGEYSLVGMDVAEIEPGADYKVAVEKG